MDYNPLDIVTKCYKNRIEKYGDNWYKPQKELDKMKIDELREYMTVFVYCCSSIHYANDKALKFYKDNRQKYFDTCTNIVDKLLGKEMLEAYDYYFKANKEYLESTKLEQRWELICYVWHAGTTYYFLSAYMLVSKLKKASSTKEILEILNNPSSFFDIIIESDKEKDYLVKMEVFNKVVHKDWDNPIDIEAMHLHDTLGI